MIDVGFVGVHDIYVVGSNPISLIRKISRSDFRLAGGHVFEPHCIFISPIH